MNSFLLSPLYLQTALMLRVSSRLAQSAEQSTEQAFATLLLFLGRKFTAINVNTCRVSMGIATSL
jgi:hypothetical protein